MTEIDTLTQFPQPDDRGWLVFRDLPRDLQNREDSTLAADHARARPDHFEMTSAPIDRPATDTERLLLAHLGYELPDELVTRVQWISAGVRRRTWPALEGSS